MLLICRDVFNRLEGDLEQQFVYTQKTVSISCSQTSSRHVKLGVHVEGSGSVDRWAAGVSPLRSWIVNEASLILRESLPKLHAGKASKRYRLLETNIGLVMRSRQPFGHRLSPVIQRQTDFPAYITEHDRSRAVKMMQSFEGRY